MLFLNHTPLLNELELDIYRYVATNIEKVVFMRIRELADETHCSTTTILRFCKKFECDGFSEFKTKLKIYLEDTQKETAIKGTDPSSLAYFISRFPDQYYEEKINEAIRILNEKDLIWFIGYGSSNIVAEYGAMYFSSLVNVSINLTDTFNHPLNYFNETLANNTCIVILSVSGETKTIINNVKHFITKETPIISITNSADSTIAKLSNVNIPYYTNKEQIGDTDVTTQVPAIHILEYLAKEFRKRKEETDH